MLQRGVNLPEITTTMERGWPATDAKAGTEGRVYVFEFDAEWEGRYFEEKELTVYFKETDAGETILLTVKARYGMGFPRPVGGGETR